MDYKAISADDLITTWPYSQEMIARETGHLSPEAKRKVLRDNAAALYGLGYHSPHCPGSQVLPVQASSQSMNRQDDSREALQ